MDRNDQVLWLAVSRGYRILRSVRDIVEAHQEADDALILARALMSAALTALWLGLPDDEAERIRRGRIYLRDTLKARAVQIRELEAMGNPAPEGESAELWAAKAEDVEVEGNMPPESVLAAQCGFGEVYSYVYRSGSASVHFSLGAALEGLDAGGQPVTSIWGVKMRLQEGQPERAATALLYACLVYAMLLEATEPRLKHRLGEPTVGVLTGLSLTEEPQSEET